MVCPALAPPENRIGQDRLFSQEIADLPLPLVTPLSADNDKFHLIPPMKRGLFYLV
jgi:hypothetical protein